jgi:hypothetical protein
MAVAELAWLLERGYAPTSSLKLVGDRHALTERQRMAVLRSTCSESSRRRRQAREATLADMHGQAILLDGFNVLTTIEAALGGAVILRCRDGTYRDLAGVHGTYRKVAETRPAIRMVGTVLEGLGVARALWLLDRPVSNSGRLKGQILEAGASESWEWTVELAPDPDPVLAASAGIVATADSAILDRGPRWFNLARAVIERQVPSAQVVDLDVHNL